MKSLMNLWTWLQGKKVYGVCLLGILYAVSGWYLQYITPQQAMQYIFLALGGIGFRSAGAKLQTALTVLNETLKAQ